MNTNSRINPKSPIKPHPRRISREARQQQFKRKVTVFTIFCVIFGSVAAGIVTAFLAYTLGRQSLSAVTTPSENPTQKIVKGENQRATNQEFKIMKEKEILVRVYDFVHKQKQENKAQSSAKN